MINHQLVNYNGNLYFLKRHFNELLIKPDRIQDLRELLKCDIVLRKDNHLWFCELIPEAEIIEETKGRG
jgi:hypothetical protein